MFCQLFQNFYNYNEFVKIACCIYPMISDLFVRMSRKSIIIIALSFNNKFIQLYNSKRNLNKQFKN